MTARAVTSATSATAHDRMRDDETQTRSHVRDYNDRHLESPDTRIFSRQEIETLIKRLDALGGGGGVTLTVMTYWQGEQRWARNRANMTSDRRDVQVVISREISGGYGMSMTNQIDDVSLAGAMRAAEASARKRISRKPMEMKLLQVVLPVAQTTTWSDTTFNRTPEQNGKLVYQLTEQSETNNLLSAGYLESRGQSIGFFERDPSGRESSYYGELTQAQCSMTVRHPKGEGSGWAGVSGYDFAKLDEAALAKRALDKCLSGLNPVRIEPGRYTTILESQAVADLVGVLVKEGLERAENRNSDSPFYLGWDDAVGRGRSKLGLKVMDDRITISHDPSDPELGMLPIPGVQPVTWIKNGVLNALNYPRPYALSELNESESIEQRSTFRMSGGTTSMEEMIANTKRGLLVTRFSGVRLMDKSSLLATGLTRDGLWLIENGKISKAVRNFRFTESPLFVLNNVVSLGVPVPIFSPMDYPQFIAVFPKEALHSVVVPPIQVNDFSFTSTIDAI